MIQLNIGAGEAPMPGEEWTNNDARALPGIDLVCDARDILNRIGSRSCTHVRATHLLEHFGHRITDAVLAEWVSLLCSGGLLYVEVPNLGWQARALVTGEAADDEVVRLMYGDQDYEGNAHYTAFTARKLEDHFKRAGLVQVSVIDVGMVLCATGVRP